MLTGQTPDSASPRLLALVSDRAMALRKAEARLGAFRRLGVPDAPWPWVDLLLPFLEVFEQEVRRRAPSFDRLLSPDAQGALRRSLLEPLSGLVAPSLALRFAVHKALSPVRTAPEDTIHYRRFVEACLGDGFRAWMADYPGLERACAALLEGRIAGAAEWVERYEADRAQLAEHLLQGRDPGPILALRTGLSDPHRGGRCVLGLTTAAGPTLYYHPKDLGLFAGFNGLLAWINARGNPRPLRPTRSLPRPGYGWMEEVAPRPCAGPKDVAWFYHRAGQLLCLVYVLNGTDIHHENLIACGEHPVLIDLETLFHPDLDPSHFGEEDRGMDESLSLATHLVHSDSVLRTLMLPYLFIAPDGSRVDLSALGASEAGGWEVQVRAWAPLNTDGMAPVWRAAAAPTQANTVRLGGEAVDAGDHLPEILAGFAWMHRFLRAHRPALLAPGSPLEAMRGLEGRFIFRTTGVYYRLLGQLAEPAALQDGSGTAPCLRGLARPFQPAGAAHPLWALQQSECAALARRDIPCFTMVTDDRSLWGEGLERLPGAFAASGWEVVGRRLAALDEPDLERQLAYIRGAFALAAAEGPERAPAEGLPWRDHPEGGPEPFLEAALAVADTLRRTALSASPGSATWLGARRQDASGHPSLAPLGLGLYDGQAGVAHFLAALEHATGGAGCRDLALAALEPLRRRLAAGSRTWAVRNLDLGGATGWGSLVYSFTRCAGWLELPELLADAERAAGFITPERIAGDAALDVMAGCAGACLGLLALHGAAPGGRWLAAAAACGDRLLDQQRPGPGGSGAWSTTGAGVLQGGFAHGAAGIAYALTRLFQATGEARFRDAAERAFAFERALFDPERGTWADQWRDDGGPLPEYNHGWCAWCHGAPGIGLALAGSLPVLDAPRIRGEVEAAVAAIRRRGMGPMNHLCCGNFGLAELLFTAGPALGRPEWRAESLRLAAAALARATEHPFGHGGFETPVFYRGAAGCAYQALRMAFPERLPSALLWQ